MASTLAGLGETGILFFPVTPFTADGHVNIEAYRRHLETRLALNPDAIFAACGTGEFHALALDEYALLVASAVEVGDGRVPVIAGAGYGAELCREYLRRAEEAGADGVLLFPPTSVVSGQDGLVAHYTAVAKSTSLPIIVYQRDGVRFSAAVVTRLLDCGNIIGLKDGRGDLEAVTQIVHAARGRWSFFNGMPTAELSAPAYNAVGVRPYSSAVFAFLPEVATAFRAALLAGDTETTDRLIGEFFAPFAVLRDSGSGYAVSLIKAGLRLRGEDVGGVRAPLVDPTAEHIVRLNRLMEQGLTVAAA